MGLLSSITNPIVNAAKGAVGAVRDPLGTIKGAVQGHVPGVEGMPGTSSLSPGSLFDTAKETVTGDVNPTAGPQSKLNRIADMYKKMTSGI